MKQLEHDFFKDLISKSKLKMPSPDFEDQVMQQIKMEDAIQSQPISWRIKVSWMLLIFTIVLGVITFPLLSQVQANFFTIPLGTIKLVFELVFTVFVLLQLDSLLKYSFQQRNGIQLINQLRKS